MKNCSVATFNGEAYAQATLRVCTGFSVKIEIGYHEGVVKPSDEVWITTITGEGWESKVIGCVRMENDRPVFVKGEMKKNDS